MTLADDLKILDRLTDGEADNLRQAIRQGDLDDQPFTWAVVKDSWPQMPADVQATYGDPATISAALERMLALVGEGASVVATYDLPEYAELGQTDEEIALLVKHDLGEILHEFEPGTPGVTPEWACKDCGDTAEGLMHSNTWRNVEPLLEENA